MAPIIPVIANDGLVHRVSADTQRTWVEEHMTAANVRLLAQCGNFVIGGMRPEGWTMLTCLACIVCHVREADWNPGPYRCNVPMCGDSGVCEECRRRGAR